MRLLVIGGSGQTGRLVIGEALERGMGFLERLIHDI